VQKGKEANCGLHPLIHTRPGFNLAQNMDLCRCEEKKTPIEGRTIDGGAKKGLGGLTLDGDKN